MSFSVGKSGIVSDPNIVPLIDILLVLLVILCSSLARRGESGRKFPRSAMRGTGTLVLYATNPA